MARILCDQCEAIAINGVPCHETGCPNSSKEWERTQIDGEDYICPVSVESGRDNIPDWYDEEDNYPQRDFPYDPEDSYA